MEIKVVSRLNYDGYEMNGKDYGIWEVDSLARELDLDDIADIVWVKGRNTFTGKEVSDKFLARMQEHLYKAFRNQFE